MQVEDPVDSEYPPPRRRKMRSRTPPAWNRDGSWFVVKDDLDRLLLVTTADPSRTRVLVKGGYGQAVIDTDLLDNKR